MQLIHSLPDTTFSDIKEKGDYPAEKKTVLTLSELEYWLTIAITDYYHQKVHSSIKFPPIEQYRDAILGSENKSGAGYPAASHKTKSARRQQAMTDHHLKVAVAKKIGKKTDDNARIAHIEKDHWIGYPRAQQALEKRLLQYVILYKTIVR